jgi:hypothetical protein
MEAEEAEGAVPRVDLMAKPPLCLSNKTSITKKQDATSSYSSSFNGIVSTRQCSVVGRTHSRYPDCNCFRDRNSYFYARW